MTIVAGSGAVVTTKRLFSRAVDISQHKHFNFLLYGNADSAPGAPCASPGGNGSPVAEDTPACPT